MNLFGVPTLLNKVAKITNPIAIIVADVKRVIGLFSPPQWGIYSQGKLIIEPDSILDFSYKKEAKISTYPQQDGAFESYNKVQTPFNVKLRMTKSGGTSYDWSLSGGNDEKQSFIIKLDKLQKSLELYDIYTPEYIYMNVNITGIGLNRSARNGVSLLTFDVTGQEIIGTAKIGYTNTKDPKSSDPVNTGTVQTQEPSIELWKIR